MRTFSDREAARIRTQETAQNAYAEARKVGEMVRGLNERVSMLEATPDLEAMLRLLQDRVSRIEQTIAGLQRAPAPRRKAT